MEGSLLFLTLVPLTTIIAEHLKVVSIQGNQQLLQHIVALQLLGNPVIDLLIPRIARVDVNLGNLEQVVDTLERSLHILLHCLALILLITVNYLRQLTQIQLSTALGATIDTIILVPNLQRWLTILLTLMGMRAVSLNSLSLSTQLALLEVYILQDVYFWVVKNGLKCNAILSSRLPENREETWKNRLKNPQSDDLFIFLKSQKDDIRKYSSLENCYLLDDYIVCTKENHPDLNNYKIETK